MRHLRLAVIASLVVTGLHLGAFPIKAVSAALRNVEGGKSLSPLLRTAAVDFHSVIWKKFVDLDQDGRKEILVHGTGRIRKLPTRVTMVQAREKSIDANGNLVLHPLRTDGNRVFGVFRYDLLQSDWVPLLLGSYRATPARRGRWSRLLRSFKAEDLVGDGSLEIRVELAEHGMSGEVHHKIYLLGAEGFRCIYAFSHPKFGIGGLEAKKNEIVETKGIRTPFQSPAVYYQSLKAITTYNWLDGHWVVKDRRLSWHDFTGDLPWRRSDSARLSRSIGGKRAYRRVWHMQKAKDAGRLPGRGDPNLVARLQAHRLPDGVVRWYQKKGLCVLGLQGMNARVAGQEDVVYLYQPFFRHRGNSSIWLATGELQVQNR